MNLTDKIAWINKIFGEYLLSNGFKLDSGNTPSMFIDINLLKTEKDVINLVAVPFIQKYTGGAVETHLVKNTYVVKASSYPRKFYESY